jgi:hypothetical protein
LYTKLLHQFSWGKVATLQMGGVLHLAEESAINRLALHSAGRVSHKSRGLAAFTAAAAVTAEI